MKRELEITVDLKVQQYSPIKLKQFDSTRIKFKVINDATIISLSKLTSYLIFEKPDGRIVYQNCTIEEDIIVADLLQDCLRENGKASIELQIFEDEDIVSTFKIPVSIEASAKEHIESDNTPNYIEILEGAMAEEKQRQLNEDIREENENIRISNENTRKESEVTRTNDEKIRESNEEARKNAETSRASNEAQRISNEEDRISAENERVDNYEMIKSYIANHAAITYKYRMILADEIEAGANITLPFYYKVGARVMDVYFRGEHLLLSSDDIGTNGHYQEVGENNSASNIIKLTNDWSCKIGDYFEFVVRGEYSNDT